MAPREWRKRAKLKCHEVADLLGCSPMSLWNYETGARSVPLPIALKYEEVSDKKVTSEDLNLIRQRWLRLKTRKAA